MTLSLAQARTIVNGGGGTPVPQYEPGDPNANPFDTSGGGGGTTTSTTAGQINLPTFDQSAGDIGVMPQGFEPIVGFPGYYFNPDLNEVKVMTNTSFDANGTPVATFHTLSKAERAAFGQAYAKFRASGGGGTGAGGTAGVGTAADHYATDVSAGTAAANRAEQARQFDIAQAESQRQYNLTHGLAENQYDQTVLGNRNAAGLSVANLANTLAENAYTRAKDPGNFPALLASYSGMEQGNPALTTLLGQGYQIPQAPGANPLADPRFQAQMAALYNYGTGPTAEQINNVRMARETLGDAAARQGFATFAALDAANAPKVAAAGGADFNTTGPTNILAGEAGPEHVSVTPESRYTTPYTPPTGAAPTGSPTATTASVVGSLPAGSANPTADFFRQWPTYTPEQQQRLLGIARVQNIAAQNGGTLPQSFYNYTGTINPDPNAVGQTYTPAQGTAEALYKALKPFGYAPREVMDALQAGNAPGPNMIAGKFGQRLQQENPSLWSLLQAAVQARLGSAGLGDYLAQAGRYNQAGFGSAGGVVR